MPSLRKRKDRDNKYFLDYRDVDDTRFRIDTGTQDVETAKLWKSTAENLLAQARLGIIPKVGRIDADIVFGKKKIKEEEQKPSLRLEEFKKIYADRCRYDLEQAEKTIELNILAFDSFIRIIGNKRVNFLTDNEVIKWKRWMQKRRSKTTVSMYHRQLRAAFRRGMKWKVVAVNPFDAVEVASWNRHAEGDNTKDMTYNEVRQILKTIDAYGEKQFGDYVRFALYTGCRRNEILFLTVENLDLENRSMLIHAQKTSKVLYLPINKALLRVIDGMLLPKSGYIFRSNSTSRGRKKRNQPWSKHWVTHRFKHYIRRCELNEIYSLHSLRHTYATYLRQKGIPLDVVQKLLGHSSVETTAYNYDHSMALHFRNQADLVDFEDVPLDEGEDDVEAK